MLKAREGYSYTNGTVYGKEINLGVNDSPSNWREIKDEDIPIQEELTPEEIELLERLLPKIDVGLLSINK